jgi:hypothetical protein
MLHCRYQYPINYLYYWTKQPVTASSAIGDSLSLYERRYRTDQWIAVSWTSWHPKYRAEIRYLLDNYYHKQ